MRTPEQIELNSKSILKAMNIIKSQLELLENEYQQNAIRCIGEKNETFTLMQTNLKNAWDSLNSLFHMEIDYAADLERELYEEEEMI